MRLSVKRSSAAVLAYLPQIFAGLLFLFYAVVLLWHAKPPLLGDLSNWAYSGELLAHHMVGIPDPWHVLKHYPVPNSLLTGVIGLLCVVLPFTAAVKALLILYLLFCLAAVQRLAKEAQTSTLVWCIAPAGFFLAVNFWYGFLAFQIGVALLFFFVAELLQTLRQARKPKPVVLSVLLLLLFFTHAVPFIFACMLLLFFALQTGELKLLRLLGVPAVLLILYGVGRMHNGNVDATALPPVEAHNRLYLLVYKVNTYLKSFGLVNPTLSTRHSLALVVFGKLGFLVTVVVSLAVSLALLWVFCRAVAMTQLLRYPFLSMASAIALFGYLCTGQTLLGISDPGSRILQTVLWLALFFCVARGSASRPLRIAAAGSIILALAGAALFWTVPWHDLRASHEVLPASIEGLAKAPSGYAAIYMQHAAQGKWEDPVFPTGLLLNDAEDHRKR